MLRSLKPELSHEDLFIERYQRLLNRALQLTERNRQEAEDLLHDAFVHFTLVRPDLNAINNLDNYMLTILRNLHLSHIRRAARSAHGPRSLVDFDSLQIGLRADDLRTQMQIHDELRLICHYACVRKKPAACCCSAFSAGITRAKSPRSSGRPGRPSITGCRS